MHYIKQPAEWKRKGNCEGIQKKKKKDLPMDPKQSNMSLGRKTWGVWYVLQDSEMCMDFITPRTQSNLYKLLE